MQKVSLFEMWTGENVRVSEKKNLNKSNMNSILLYALCALLICSFSHPFSCSLPSMWTALCLWHRYLGRTLWWPWVACAPCPAGASPLQQEESLQPCARSSCPSCPAQCVTPQTLLMETSQRIWSVQDTAKEEKTHVRWDNLLLLHRHLT